MTPCPLACGSDTEPRVIETAGVAIFICPECLGIAFDAAILCDPRRPVDLSRMLRPIVETIRRENSIDPLTQVKNRAFFFRRLAAEINAARHRSFISVAAFHFDHEGLYAKLGGRGGDTAIQSLAARLIASARAGDDLARVEPDTFGLILRNADETTASEIAARIANSIAVRTQAREGVRIMTAVAPADGQAPEEAWQESVRRARALRDSSRDEA